MNVVGRILGQLQRAPLSDKCRIRFMAVVAASSGRKECSENAEKIIKLIKEAFVAGDDVSSTLGNYQGPFKRPLVGEVLRNLNEANQAEIFFDWASERKGYSHSLFTYNCLLDALVKGEAAQVAEKRYLEMKERGFKPDEYSCAAVILAFCNASDPDKAHELYREMSQSIVRGSLVVNNVLIDGFCKVGKVDKAQVILRRMEGYCKPDVVTYNTFIRGLCDLKRMNEAEIYLDRMEECGIEPDVVTYCLLIDGFGKEKMADRAAEYAEEMKQKGIAMNAVAYKTLVNAHALSWHYEAAYNTFREMQNCGFEADEALYKTVYDVLWKAPIAEPKVILKEMVAKGFVPAEPMFARVIWALCRPPTLMEAYGLYQESVRLGHYPHVKVFVWLVNHLADMDKPREMFEVYEKWMEKHRPNKYTFHNVVSCLCRANKVELAHLLMREVFFKFKNFIPITASFNCLLYQFCGIEHRNPRFYELDKALKLFHQMIDKKQLPNLFTFQILIHGLCRCKRINEADELYNRMKEFNCSPDFFIFKTLISGFCKARRYGHAESMFQFLLTKFPGSPDDKTLDKIHNMILTANKKELQQREAYLRLEASNAAVEASERDNVVQLRKSLVKIRRMGVDSDVIQPSVDEDTLQLKLLEQSSGAVQHQLLDQWINAAT